MNKHIKRGFGMACFVSICFIVLSAAFAQTDPAPTVTSITPAMGNTGGPAYITDLAGTNFQDGIAVKLMKSGESDINATNVTVDSPERIICEFDLAGADDGYWDVRVANPDGQGATLQDGFRVTQGATIPSILFKKSGPAEASVGDTVQYGLTVSNTGNVPLHNVVIDDAMLGSITVGPLAVTETVTNYQYYTILASDPNPLVNTATATGNDGVGTTVSDTNAHSIEIVDEVLDLKKVGPASAKNGETVTFTFTVTNTGDQDLNNGQVTDSLLDADWSWDFGDLGAGQAKTYSQDYTITDANVLPLTNTATATAFIGSDTEVKDEDSWTINAAGSSGSCSLTAGAAPSLLAIIATAAMLLPVGIARRRRRA